MMTSYSESKPEGAHGSNLEKLSELRYLSVGKIVRFVEISNGNPHPKKLHEQKVAAGVPRDYLDRRIKMAAGNAKKKERLCILIHTQSVGESNRLLIVFFFIFFSSALNFGKTFFFAPDSVEAGRGQTRVTSLARIFPQNEKGSLTSHDHFYRSTTMHESCITDARFPDLQF